MTMRAILVGLFTSLFSLTMIGQQDIRSVDFKNFQYLPYCADDEPMSVSVVNGEFLHQGSDGISDFLRLSVQSIEFGDLDGDSKDEAVVITVCHPGGTGQFSEGFIFSSGKTKPKLTGRFPGGDRAAGGLVSAVIRDGRLLIERNEERGGLCCPNTTLTIPYRFSKGKLTVAGDGVRKELYPAQRLQDYRIGTAIVVVTTIDYKNRYVISGREGQELTVTTDQSNSPIYGFAGGKRIEDGMNGLKISFNTDENIVFDVYNNDVAPRLYTITVRVDDVSNCVDDTFGTMTSSWKTPSGYSASYQLYEKATSCLICGDFVMQFPGRSAAECYAGDRLGSDS